ncbi:PhnD/SsuA/transferrin family substrate-binding protein [Silvanigrella aquatica]|uniref:Uncharacterized protein n=1 Tax=Silvanigrella aquatica TaxID=1915309 RepID=A0A1L4CZ74_9BACT|nr:PhnD/SsuA/transferrin family substrate-binding protein [Silvanigrella aquatica]APJ03254.1 hypothetical protein AXG55_04790 [Silvanigrella aquatica]
MSKAPKYLNFILIFKLLLFCFLISGCTKLWMGTPELGSKSFPIEFYINSPNPFFKNDDAPSHLQSCIEEKTGYRVNFNFVSDEKAVISALTRGTAQYGVISSIAYVGASTRTPLKSILIFSQKGSPSSRAVIIGNTSVWKNFFQKSGLALNAFTFHHEATLQYFNKATVAYENPESVIGFFVPRMYFLQRNIFPSAAIFVGSFSSVFQAIDDNLATIGVVSENEIDTKFPNATPIQLGTQFSNYIVLGLSQNLPGQVLIENQSNINSTSATLTKGMELCSQIKAADFKKLFQADGVQKSNEKLFTFTKELYEFQQENIRILTQRVP